MLKLKESVKVKDLHWPKRKQNRKIIKILWDFFLALLYFELLIKEAKAGEKLNNQNIRLFDKALYLPIKIYKQGHRKIITGVIN